MPLLIHSLRLLIVAGLALAVARSHQQARTEASAVRLTAALLPRVQAVLPTAHQLGGPSLVIAGGRDLLSETGQPVGTILQTSPIGDTAIGFSGSTNLLLVCNTSQEIVAIDLLSSGDTRDHVAAVLRDDAFWRQFHGRTLKDLIAGSGPTSVTAGATLTSLAIIDAISLRLGSSSAAGRFATQPTLADLKRLFPNATRLEQDPGSRSVLRAYDGNDIPLGWALRTSPVADDVIGYQGPTDSVIAFDASGKACGLLVIASFDNEPYVGYVRDDAQFSKLFAGQTFEELAGIVPADHGVEGVSGATMTSRAIAEAILRTASAEAERLQRTDRGFTTIITQRLAHIEPPQWFAIAIIILGLATGFTRLRGGPWGRVILPLIVLTYMGFGAGAVLSQAQLWGWAQAGLPQAATVLLFLTAVALVTPMTTGRNVYCSHLCSHGAAQQLLARVIRPRSRPWLNSVRRPLQATLKQLRWLPVAFLVTAFAVSYFHLPFNLVDLEPFDAYLPAVAGLAALVWFALSLTASCFVPMAYCHYGCPTGALLDHLRFHRRSDRLSWRDALLAGCLVAAILLSW